MQRVLRKFLEISINFNSPRYFSSSKLSVGILGVPFDKGASKRGVNEGPKALRQAGLIDEIKSISKNVDVKDYGDVHYDLLLPTKSSFFSTSNNNNITDVRKTNGIKELRHVAACNEVLASKIEQIINDGRMPVALGGDHSMAIGKKN
jgi:arginase